MLVVGDAVENLPGFGMSGTINGVCYTVGNARLTPEIVMPILQNSLPPGATVIWLCDATQALAAFVLADVLRPQAVDLVKALQQGGMGVSILSGDAPHAVAYFAEKLGIVHWQAGLTPEGKLAALTQWQEKGEVIAMVGDGINDAPVLAGAPVSIAMGGGTQMARASGDVVLLSENLLEIDHARITSRFGMNVVRQNFIWALGYNLIALPFAASGHLSPWLAALGMSVSSLVVVLNALRLR
jgi:Cu2+-exporting ATPase